MTLTFHLLTPRSTGPIIDSWGVCLWSFMRIGVKGKHLWEFYLTMRLQTDRWIDGQTDSSIPPNFVAVTHLVNVGFGDLPITCMGSNGNIRSMSGLGYWGFHLPTLCLGLNGIIWSMSGLGYCGLSLLSSSRTTLVTDDAGSWTTCCFTKSCPKGKFVHMQFYTVYLILQGYNTTFYMLQNAWNNINQEIFHHNIII